MTTPSHQPSSHSADDHQRWLWCSHIIGIIVVVLTAGLRINSKWRRLAFDDAIVLVAHILYLAYWLLLLFALLSGLGKSEKLVSSSGIERASKLVFASQIVLVLILTTIKTSVACLIETIFTRDFKNVWIWCRGLIVASMVQAVIGLSLVSTSCGPANLLNASSCPAGASRWIAYSTLESVVEIALMLPVTMGVVPVHIPTKTKIKIAAIFASRLIVFIPMWTHVAVYLNFLRADSALSGSLEFVPTAVCETLWVAIATCSATIPLLTGQIDKFTTTGMRMDSQLESSAGTHTSRSAGKQSHTSSPDDSLRSNNATRIHT